VHIKTLRFLNTSVVNLNRCAYDSLNQTAVNETRQYLFTIIYTEKIIDPMKCDCWKSH